MPHSYSRAGSVGKASALIEALGGDHRSGMCRCPAHDDRTPSLSVRERDGRIRLFCFAGCSSTDVIAALRSRGLWPIPGGSTQSSKPVNLHTETERRNFALDIIADAEQNHGKEMVRILWLYFERRGIPFVPPGAMLALPDMYNCNRSVPTLVPDDPAMIFRVMRNDEVVGAHVTWLNRSATAKRDPEEGPQRQFFGPIAGGFIKLYANEPDPKSKLIIAEGIETALSASIMRGLPAIAALSAGNMIRVWPPPAAGYVICADNDKAGLLGARLLAAKLKREGYETTIAIPPQPGMDWNDVLMRKKGTSHGE